MTDSGENFLEEYTSCNSIEDFIELQKRDPDIKRMRDKMYSFGPFFKDMVPSEIDPSFVYDKVQLLICPLDCGGDFQLATMRIRINPSDYHRHPNIILLHEMIHLHASLLSDEEHDKCQAELHKKLQDKIQDLDAILELKDIGMERLCCLFNKLEYPNSSVHDTLFFLKSLDLDLKKDSKSGKKPYKLGTIFGYNMDMVIENIRYALKSQQVSEIKKKWKEQIKSLST